MDRNEIIQQLGMYAYTAAMTGQHSQTIPADLINEVIKALKAAPEWISVKDRLPEKSGRVVAYRADTGFCADLHFSKKWNAFNTYDNDEDPETIISDITHWMPISTLPEAEAEDE